MKPSEVMRSTYAVVRKHDVCKHLQAEQRELHVLARDLLDLLALLLRDRLAPAAGQAGHRVHAAPAHHLDHVVVADAAVNHLLADFHPHFVHHAQDVAFGAGASGPTTKSGPPSA